MKIYSLLEIDIETGAILNSVSEEYSGPVALCGSAGIGDFTGLEAPGDVGTDVGSDVDVDIDGDTGDGGDDLIGEIEPGDEPEEEPGRERVEPTKPEKDVLPAELSKSLRALKQANPEHAQALKTLNNEYYTSRAFKSVFSTPDEARTVKAALDAVDGLDGINSMRSHISAIEQFDRMASEGNPKVIDGLADEFPDGFKKLVPAAIERLAKVDPSAYRETLRGPLLQVLEGDGLMDAIGSALEELKQGDANRATQQLTRIAAWYTELKKQDTEFKGRYQDPKLKDLETREQQLRTKQADIIKSNVTRDLNTYLANTMRPGITKVLEGKTLAAGGRARFENNVRAEISSILAADANYGRSLRDLIANGKVEQATQFAKPFIDRARQKAISSVYTDIYGNAPAPRRQTQQLRTTNTNNGAERQSTASDKPVPIQRKPPLEQVDWKRTHDNLWITGKAYLTNGKFVEWKK